MNNRMDSKRKLLAFIYCLITTWMITDARNPGLRVKFSAKGLNYVANNFIDSWFRKLQSESLPSLHGSSSFLGKDVKYNVTNVRVTDFSKPTFKIQTENNIQIHLTISSIELHADWHYKYKLVFVPISDSGDVDIKFKDISLTVEATLGADVYGKLSLSLKSCDVHIGDTDLSLHGGASWLYDLFTPFLESKIKSRMQSKMSDGVKEVIEKTSKKLEKMKVQKRFNYLLADYSLIGMPILQQESVEFPLKGGLYWYSNKQETPFEPKPMENLPSQNRMISLYLSDYILNSAGYALMKNGHRFATYNLAGEELLSYTRHFPIMKQLFEPLSSYPNSSLEIGMNLTKQPRIIFRNHTITGIIQGVMDFRIRLPNKTSVNYCSEDVKMLVLLKTNLYKENITATITSFRLFSNIAKTATRAVQLRKMDELVRLVAEIFIIPHLNDLGSNGLPLPSTPCVQLVNPELYTMNGYLCFMADVKYDPIV